ncbi:uncharacterized protein LOC100376284 [Saccoglossus kowalevskii]
MPQIEELDPLSLSDSEEEEEYVPRKSRKKTGKRKTASPYGQSKGISTKGRKVVDTRNKTARDLWIEGMRSGTGYLTTQSPTMNMTKRPKSAGMMNTSRELDALNGKTPRSGRGSAPTYKPQEEMYDDIIDLKRQINGLKEENEIVKTRNRRLEKESVQKQKQVEQLLDPSKCDDLRRVMNEKKPDAGAVVNSLKQKNLKLEQTLRDKEAQLSKLQNDLKSTKMEEMRIENEMYYSEILRLRSRSAHGNEHTQRRSDQPAASHQASKVKALNATILRLTETNQRLQSDNKFLKQDLESAMEGTMTSPRGKKTAVKKKKGKFDYEDMNRKELLAAVAELEEELQRYESGSFHDAKRGSHNVEGKIVLKGGLSERVEQLDKRETELLEEKLKLEEQVSRLKTDKTKLRQQIEEKEIEIQNMRQDLSRREAEQPVARPRQRPSSASSVSSSSTNKRRREEEERNRKVEELRQKHSAATIQRNWKRHKERKGDEELDDAAVLIQSSVRGHWSRKEQLQKMERSGRHSPSRSMSGRSHGHISEDDESGLDDAATTIQSAMRGHWSRKDQINKNSPRHPPLDDSDSDSYIRTSKSRSGTFQKTSQSGYGRSKTTAYSESDSDDDLIMSTPTRNSRTKTTTSSFGMSNRPGSARSSGSKSGRESPLRGELGQYSQRIEESDEDDSDDDLVIATSSYKSKSKLF